MTRTPVGDLGPRKSKSKSKRVDTDYCLRDDGECPAVDEALASEGEPWYSEPTRSKQALLVLRPTAPQAMEEPRNRDDMQPADAGTGTDDEAALAMASDFMEVVQGLFSAQGERATLQKIVDLSVSTIEGCEFAGIFIREGRVVTTPVFTDPVVVTVDALQHDCGEGPCLDAIAEGTSFYADELGNDPRWPNFGPLALASGMRSLLAFPLSRDGTFGALNLYSRFPQAFGVVDRARGLLLASVASFASSTARMQAEQVRRAEDLQAALITRETIGQAEGILIERERLTPNQAFHVLRQASQHLNLKLRDVAQGLVETGERPDTGAPLPR